MVIQAPVVGQSIGDWYDEITAAVNGYAFEPVKATNDVSGTTTSTTYTSTLTGTTAVSVTFTAARTSHMVTVSGLIIQNVGGPWNQYISYQVVGTGYSYGPLDVDSVMQQETNNNTGATGSRRSAITGLTVGNTYTVTLFYRGGGSQMTVMHRSLIVE